MAVARRESAACRDTFRAAASRAGVAAAIALVGGCTGTTRPQADGVSARPSASSPHAAAPASSTGLGIRPVWSGEVRPVLNDLDELPPAGDRGGPTKPCEPHQTWGETLPPPPEGYRSAGRMCSGMLGAVEFPACTAAQVRRAVRADQWARDPGSNVWSVRGYLRRHVLASPAVDFGPSPTASPRDYDRSWNLRVEARPTTGTCAEVQVGLLEPDAGSRRPLRPELCFADATVTCCRSEVLTHDIEVVVEHGGTASQPRACLVSPPRRPASRVILLRSAEESRSPQQSEERSRPSQ